MADKDDVSAAPYRPVVSTNGLVGCQARGRWRTRACWYAFEKASPWVVGPMVPGGMEALTWCQLAIARPKQAGLYGAPLGRTLPRIWRAGNGAAIMVNGTLSRTIHVLVPWSAHGQMALPFGELSRSSFASPTEMLPLKCPL